MKTNSPVWTLIVHTFTQSRYFLISTLPNRKQRACTLLSHTHDGWSLGLLGLIARVTGLLLKKTYPGENSSEGRKKDIQNTPSVGSLGVENLAGDVEQIKAGAMPAFFMSKF